MNRKRHPSLIFLFPLSLFLFPSLGVAGCGSDRPLLTAPEPVPSSVRLQQPEAEHAEPVTTTPAVEGYITARVRAIVNGQPILDDELREMVWQELRAADQLPEPRSTAQGEILKSGLDQLIEREVIISDAESRLQKKEHVWGQLKEFAEKEYEKQLRSMKQRSGAETDDQLRDILVTQGLTMPNLKRRIERQFIANEYVRSRIFPIIEQIGHPEIRQYYNEHPGEFLNEDRVKWQDIFIDAGSARFASRSQAKQLAEEMCSAPGKGADFVQLSAQHDQGDSVYRHGDGAGQKHGEIKPIEVEPLLFEMKEGQIGLVELPTGFHVIRLDKREFAGPQPFDDKTQSAIRKKLQNIIADREYKRIVHELRRKATVQIFLEN